MESLGQDLLVVGFEVELGLSQIILGKVEVEDGLVAGLAGGGEGIVIVLVDVVEEVGGLEVGVFQAGYGFGAPGGEERLCGEVEAELADGVAGLGDIVAEVGEFGVEGGEVVGVEAGQELALGYAVAGGDEDLVDFAGGGEGEFGFAGKDEAAADGDLGRRGGGLLGGGGWRRGLVGKVSGRGGGGASGGGQGQDYGQGGQGQPGKQRPEGKIAERLGHGLIPHSNILHPDAAAEQGTQGLRQVGNRPVHQGVDDRDSQ